MSLHAVVLETGVNVSVGVREAVVPCLCSGSLCRRQRLPLLHEVGVVGGEVVPTGPHSMPHPYSRPAEFPSSWEPGNVPRSRVPWVPLAPSGPRTAHGVRGLHPHPAGGRTVRDIPDALPWHVGRLYRRGETGCCLKIVQAEVGGENPAVAIRPACPACPAFPFLTYILLSQIETLNMAV